MEPFGSILGALGSIASLVSLFALWKQRKSWILPTALLSIFLLTALSSYFSFRYYQVTQPDVVRRAKIDALRASSRAFLSKYKPEPSYWDPGINEGIVKSGLIILELHKDIIPDTYRKIKSDIEADILFAQQHRDNQEQRAAMDTAAKNIVTVLKAFAGGEEEVVRIK